MCVPSVVSASVFTRLRDSFPESLNGETGLVCSLLCGPSEFERVTVKAILW